MKDGTTHMAHKAEHAVDMETGAVIAVTLQAADQGDTTTVHETVAEAGEAVATLIEREAEKAPEAKPQVSINGIKEIVADKGYHSGQSMMLLGQSEVRTYIPEPNRGRRHWVGKAEEQQAVYANRRRVQGGHGKQLLKKRGELIERPFAHCYETGGMRRTHLRGRENILKRQLIHVCAFNLSLIFRQLLGAGTPRELKNRGGEAFAAFIWLQIALQLLQPAEKGNPRPQRRLSPVRESDRHRCHRRRKTGIAPRAARPRTQRPLRQWCARMQLAPARLLGTRGTFAGRRCRSAERRYHRKPESPSFPGHRVRW
jgi:transposase